jgi:hypothetical protein
MYIYIHIYIYIQVDSTLQKVPNPHSPIEIPLTDPPSDVYPIPIELKGGGGKEVPFVSSDLLGIAVIKNAAVVDSPAYLQVYIYIYIYMYIYIYVYIYIYTYAYL